MFPYVIETRVEVWENEKLRGNTVAVEVWENFENRDFGTETYAF